MTAPAAFPRIADHPVDPMFLERRSSRAFTGEPLDEADLLTVLEAARWAPSGANTQPVRMVWARKGEPGFDTIAGTLAPSNRLWAEQAGALVVIASTTEMDRDGTPVALPSHAFDAGAAWMSLALQAHLLGYVAHAMGGFDKGTAAERLGLTARHQLHVVVAIGRQGAAESLPEPLRAREAPSPRKPLGELARHAA